MEEGDKLQSYIDLIAWQPKLKPLINVTIEKHSPGLPVGHLDIATSIYKSRSFSQMLEAKGSALEDYLSKLTIGGDDDGPQPTTASHQSPTADLVEQSLQQISSTEEAISVLLSSMPTSPPMRGPILPPVTGPSHKLTQKNLEQLQLELGFCVSPAEFERESDEEEFSADGAGAGSWASEVTVTPRNEPARRPKRPKRAMKSPSVVVVS